jgi:hypothetical protein
MGEPEQADRERALADGVAPWFGGDLPAECRAGVAANLIALGEHLALVRSARDAVAVEEG